MVALHIRMFGETRVIDGDRIVGPRDFGGVKPRQVLEVLALHAGHPVTKDTLIDAIVDSYFSVLEDLGERIVNLEEDLTLVPDTSSLHEINDIKKEIIFLRKAVWPLREAVSFLERGDSDLLSSATRLYFRDVYDHTVQVIDTVETYRDLLSGMLDLYLSSISNRINEIMKFMTVIGTIFMPLTFLVGVYGMNFKHMPELEWQYSYFILWGLMIGLSIAMIIYFRRKRWL